MSSYIAVTKHPETGKWENAQWIDDYYGHHQYGVKFEDGTVVRDDFRRNFPLTSTTAKPVNPEFGWSQSDVNPSDTRSTDRDINVSIKEEPVTAPHDYTPDNSIVADDELDKFLIEVVNEHADCVWSYDTESYGNHEAETCKKKLEKLIDQRVAEARTNGQSSVLTKIIPWVRKHHPELTPEIQGMIADITATLTKATKDTHE